MKLYWAPQSRSLSALWLMEETGQPYERVKVDIRGSAHPSAELLAVNPMGKVPALRDGDAVIAEQAAICAYVAERYPQAGLAPPIGDPARARYLYWLFFYPGCIEPAITEKFAKLTIPEGSAGWGSHARVVDVLDHALAHDGWIAGQKFTAADIMTIMGLRFGMQFGMIDKRPNFEAYVARGTARPAFARALAIEAAEG